MKWYNSGGYDNQNKVYFLVKQPKRMLFLKLDAYYKFVIKGGVYVMFLNSKLISIEGYLYEKESFRRWEMFIDGFTIRLLIFF